MAMLNEILGAAARFNQLLSRKYNLVGGAPSPQLTPEIQPGASLDLAEDQILGSVISCTGAIKSVAVAAKNSVARLRNPVGSGILVIVDAIAIQSLGNSDEFAAGVGYVGTDLAQVPAAGTWCRNRDTRAGAALTLSAARLSFDNSPPGQLTANLFTNGNGATANGAPFVYTVPVMLGPGGALDFFNANVNTRVYHSIAWRERPLAPGEVGPF